MSQETRVSAEDFKGERSKKRLKCSADSTTHMKEHIKKLRERLSSGEPVAWIYRGVPQEILNSMDIPIIDSINVSATISAKQMSRYYLDRLNQDGYFRDLCRYCTVPLGYAFDHKPEIAPWGGWPKPTVMIACHLDDPAMKIWELYAREFDCPLYMIDFTYMSRLPRTDRYWEDLREADAEIESCRLDQAVEEYDGMVRFLETYTGKTFSETELSATMLRESRQMEYYWKATDLACRTAEKCPISITDAFANVPAAIFFLGTEYGVEHARKYYEEVKEKVDKGEVVCENEKVRLFWAVDIAIWFTLGFYNTWEEKYGAVFLPSAYMPVEGQFGIRRNLGDPVRTMTSMYTTAYRLGWLNPTTAKQYFLHVTSKYRANGAIFLVAESCKLLYSSILFAREALEKQGVATLEINSDMVDARDWDDTKMKSLVTSFVETLTP